MSKGGYMRGDVTEASLRLGDQFDYGPTELTPELNQPQLVGKTQTTSSGLVLYCRLPSWRAM